MFTTHNREQEQYMSQPIDEISQSSYIKINKKFLQQLKGMSQVQDMERFRQDSDQDDICDHSYQDEIPSKLMSIHNSKHDQDDMHEGYSPVKSSFYDEEDNEQQKGSQEQKAKQEGSLRKLIDSNKKEQRKIGIPFYQTKKENIQSPHSNFNFSKQSQKISEQILTPFQKKPQNHTPADNTFEYYLLHKSKLNDEDISLNSPTNHNYASAKSHNLLSPKQTVSSIRQSLQQQQDNSKFVNNASQITRTNYKKLLDQEIVKNKQLQRHIYKLQSRLAQLSLQFQSATKSNKKLQKDLLNSEKVRKQNHKRMKEIDGKLEGIKTIYKDKKCQKQEQALILRRQNKVLRDQNQKYKIFVQTLAQSIFVLKGKRPKQLQDIWQEWKDVFQSFSKNKWASKAKQSDNKLFNTSTK